MNRQLFCIILQLKGVVLNRAALKCLLLGTMLLSSHSLLAEKLYRWVEPDGSITFSPNKPANGVEYKEVDAIGGNPTGGNLAQSGQEPQIERSTPSILATSEHDTDTTQARINETPITTRPAAAIATQKLTYAPETSPGITRSMPTPAAQPTVSAPDGEQDLQAIYSDNKRRQCQDLSKRVLSLEQRLRSKLEPEDMDNTVVAMARYQRSYDQYCVN